VELFFVLSVVNIHVPVMLLFSVLSVDAVNAQLDRKRIGKCLLDAGDIVEYFWL
jgi:hypothetical protein